MPEPDAVCCRVWVVPSAWVTTTCPPGSGMPLGAVRTAPVKYWTTSVLPWSQTYRTVLIGAGDWAQAALAARNDSARQPVTLQSMVVSFGPHAALPSSL